MVIVVGIPLAYVYDPMVYLKKDFLNNNKNFEQFYKNNGIKSKDYDSWYNLNGLIAVNQSLGILIRNSHDYGYLLLIDYRYGKEDYRQFISGWLRNKAKYYWKNNNSTLITDIKKFFDNF